MGIIVHQVPVGGFDKNFSYLIYATNSHEAAVVDPTGDMNLLYAAAQDLHLTINAIYLTHTHFDHIDGIPMVRERSGNVPIYVHRLGVEVIAEQKNITAVEDQDLVTLNNHLITVLHTPGHSDDSICLYIPAEQADSAIPKVITGDTLFVGGCGRTSATKVKDLYESLLELKNLPPETFVYPGHNYGNTPRSTIGEEIAANKYCRAGDFNVFRELRLG